jgi:hypothetical protein
MKPPLSRLITNHLAARPNYYSRGGCKKQSIRPADQEVQCLPAANLLAALIFISLLSPACDFIIGVSLRTGIVFAPTRAEIDLHWQ